MSKYKDTIMNQYNEKKSDNETMSVKLVSLLESLLASNNISVNAINSRVKESSSLQEKIEKKGEKYNCLDDITDIVGSRIITYYSNDVDKIAKIIEHEFVVDENNTIDKRKSMDPDRFGYMSLHYVCQFSPKRTSLCEYSRFEGKKFEIQIRSILQHTWAEIEHNAGYKSQIGIPKDIKRYFSRLSGLLELADDEFIRIREKLSDYEKMVSKNLLENNDEELLIDRISLKKYLNINNEIKILNEKISKINHFILKPNISLENNILSLKYLKVTTIKELDGMVKNNSVLAYEIAKEFLKDDGPDSIGEIGIGIGIFYLCYAELFIKNFTDNKIIEFLKVNKIGDIENHENTMKELKEVHNYIIKKSVLTEQ